MIAHQLRLKFKNMLKNSDFLRKISHDHLIKITAALAVLCLIVSMLQKTVMNNDVSPKKSDPSVLSKDENDIVTRIPKGHVLIPIELQNAESLSGIMGDYAFVDLFSTETKNSKQKSKKIASHVRLIRAPFNEHVFAILVKDKDSSSILNESGPYYASIKSPKEDANQITQTTSIKPQTIIEYN